VSALWLQAVGMYGRGMREATAHDKATLALERIVPEVREAYNVDYPGPDLLVFTVPARGADRHYLIDPATRALVPGGQVAIYQSDATGRFDSHGGYIWRAQRPSPTAPWQRTGVVMGEVADLSLTYAPSVARLDAIRIAVTVGEAPQPGYCNQTAVTEVQVRNH